MAAWKLPLLVAAIVVPIVVAFGLVGPGLGLPVGALAVVVIVVVAVRQRPRGPIGTASETSERRLLLVVGAPLEDPAAIAAVARLAERPGGEPAEVLALAPTRLGFLDRWASDVEGARREAQQRLVVTIASLAKAGLDAKARVGDEDPVQAVEDATVDFAATDVVLLSAPGEEDAAAAAAAAELEGRLRARFRWLVLSDPPAG